MMRPAIALAFALAVPAAAQKRLTPPEPPIALLADHEARLRLVLKEAHAPGVSLRAIVRPSFHVEYAVGLRPRPGGYEIFALRPSRPVWDYESIAMMKSGRIGSFQVEGLLEDELMAPDPGDKGGKREGKRRKRARGGPAAAAEEAEVKAVADALEEQLDEPLIRDTTGEEIARLEEGLPEDPADLPVARCAVPVEGPLAGALIRAWRRMLEDVGPDPWEAGLDGTSYEFAMTADGRTLEGHNWSPRPRTRPATLAALAEAMRDHCETPNPARLKRIKKLARRLR